MANIDKLRVSGVTYDIYDATAIHSLDNYWTSAQTNAAIEGMAEAIGEELSGKADSSAVTQEISAAVSGKADAASAVTNVDTGSIVSGGNTNIYLRIYRNGVESSTHPIVIGVGSGLTYDTLTKGVSVNPTVVAMQSDIPDVSNYFDGAVYDSSTQRINFKHGDTVKAYIDASDFIKDGMVEDVRIENGNLVIDFNTESGIQDISIPLTDIFDPSNYYTTAQTDSAIASAVSGKADSSAVTQEISAAVSGKANSSDVVTDVGVSAGNNYFTVSSTKNGSGNVVFRLSGGTGIEIYNQAGSSEAYQNIKVDTNTIQEKLVSGTSIKTINGESLLGSGNITIEAAGTIDSAMSDSSQNAVENRVIKAYADTKNPMAYIDGTTLVLS